MLVQVALKCERLPTPPAHIRLLAGVCLNVGPQVRLVRERFATLLAAEGLLTSVSSDVALEEPWSAEPLPAVRTLTSLVVCADMHAVRRHRDVHFLAVRAFTGFLVVHTTVGLAMACKVAGGAVTLTALWAGMDLMQIDLPPGLLHQSIEAVVELLQVVAITTGQCRLCWR